MGSQIKQYSWIAVVEPVEINIVVFSAQQHGKDQEFIKKLKQKGIAISLLAKGKLRIVAHLDYRQVMHEYVLEAFKKLRFYYHLFLFF